MSVFFEPPAISGVNVGTASIVSTFKIQGLVAVPQLLIALIAVATPEVFLSIPTRSLISFGSASLALESAKPYKNKSAFPTAKSPESMLLFLLVSAAVRLNGPTGI